MEKHIKLKKIGVLFVCMILFLNIVGCDREQEAFIGYGNSISNLRGGAFAACENADSVLFCYGNLLYDLEKEGETVRMLCQNPVCRHQVEDFNCLAGKFITNLQFFNEAYYYADLSYEGYFKMKGEEVREIEHTGSLNERGCAFIYNNQLYYLKFSKNDELKRDILRENLDGTGKEIIPVGEHISEYFPMEHEIFVLTMENRLYSVDDHGNEKKVLTEDKVLRFIPDGEYIYYICGDSKKRGLYRIKKDGSEKETIIQDAESFTVGGEYLYVNVESFSDTGTYLINKNSKNSKKITDRIIDVAVFQDWDRIIGFYRDEDMSQDRELIIMNTNGRGMKTVCLPRGIK